MNESTLISPTRNRPLWLSLVGLLIAFVGLAGAWFEPVTRPRLCAWQIGMVGGPATPVWLAIFFSFGLLGFLLCLWGAFSAWSGNHLNTTRASLAIMLLGFAFVVHLTLGRPIWLQYAMDGAADFTQTMNFANKFNIPLAYLISPGAGMTVDEEGWSDRFSVALMILRFGWYWFIFGSGLALVGALTAMPEKSPVARGVVPVVVIFLIAVLIMSAGPLLAQMELRSAEQAAARNNLSAAEGHYRSAIAWDEWYRVRTVLYLQIGSLRYQKGDTQSPESCLYQAIDYGSVVDYDLAMFYFSQALKTNDAILALLVRREMADRAMLQGLDTYKMGQQGAARQAWFQVLQLQPKEEAPYYMIAKADLDLADCDEAANFFKMAMPHSTNDVMRSVAISGLGDCYYKSGRFDLARAQYLLAMKVEVNTNFRALKSLTEYYYK